MNTQTLSLLERCELALNFDTTDVKQLLKDLEAAIAAERSKEQAKPLHTSEIYPDDGGVEIVYDDLYQKRVEPQQKPQQEPVAYIERITGRLAVPDDDHRRRFSKAYDPLYPAPRQIKSLSQDEIDAVWGTVQYCAFDDCVTIFARAIEAKLGVGK